MLLYFFGISLLIFQAHSATNDTEGQNSPDNLVNKNDILLWRTLLKNCKNQTTQCVENHMYKYLKQVLQYPKDYKVASFLNFAKNSVNYTEIEKGYNGRVETLSDDTVEGRSGSNDKVSLHEEGVKFLMTHDVELKLPETFFEGATLKIEPRSFDGSGALVKMEIIPKPVAETAVEGRIFFKKIKKKIGEKLMYALFALLVVIKLLAVKFLFFLPMLMGVAAAKKLLIKVLFFLFPAIKYIFKLCPYVPYGTKYHHHKHQIAHVHHLGGHHYHPHHHDSVEVIRPHAAGPPSGGSSLHHYVDIEAPHSPSYNPHENDLEYYSGGPGLGEDIISHRKDPNIESNEVSSQGLNKPSKKKNNRPLTPTEIENMVLKAEKEALIKLSLQQEKKRIQEDNIRLQEQLRQAIKVQERLKMQQVNVLTKNVLLKNSIPTVPSPFLQSPPPPSELTLPLNNLYNVPNRVVPQSILKYTGPQANNLPTNAKTKSPNLPIEAHQGTSSVSKQGATSKTQNIEYVSPKKVNATTTAQAPKPQPTYKKKEDIQEAIQKAATITFDPFYSPILQRIDNLW
ncbi:hypothetical protein WA026_012176 [Henosepilachna vigintioctopunctata]|uniref:Osiris n=1 Tax=Henosepilachna vigintioctopunctata TaxID=420089 RepID=A0AAW1V807_9CUCU